MESTIIQTLTDKSLSSDIAKQINRIMTPVDLRHTQQSEKAILTAIRLAKDLQASFHLLTVAFPVEHSTLAYDPKTHKKEFHYLADRIGKLFDIDVVPIFRSHTSPKGIILEEAKNNHIDLIVMATHDPKITDYIFRSTATDIALHFPGSVMIVR